MERIYMLKKFIFFAFVLTLAGIFENEVSAQTRVSFQKGSSTKTITSTVKPYGIRAFVLRAKAEQLIEAKITSTKKRVLINEEEGASWLQLESKAGDSTIEIVNRSKYRSRFTITFTIKDKPKPKPIRISFDKGKSSKTIDLEMFRYKKSKRYVVTAKKNQAIVVTIETTDAVERIAMDANNAKSHLDEWVDGFGSLRIRTGRDGDYVFEVIKLDEKYLKTKMKISITAGKDF